MFEKVLLPTDFSPDSGKVLEFIKDIPGIREAVLLHVVDATRPLRQGSELDRHIANAKILLEERKEALEKGGIRTKTVIEIIVHTITQGDIPLTIREKADTEKVSLIMMAARGKNTIQEIVLGSVSANVIRHATIPVLLMRFGPGARTGEGRPGLFSRVLLPVDFSEQSQNAISLLRNIPAAGEIILLHVVDKGESKKEIDTAVKRAKEKLAAIEKDLATAGFSVKALVHVGYPPDEINATAGHEDVSLILMSPRGEGWTRELRALFLGSTTSTVIRRAHHPVLVAAGRIPEM